MEDKSKKIKIKIKNKEYNIDSVNEVHLLNNEILSLLEKIHKIDLSKAKNLYKVFYFDDDGDKIYIKNKEDYNFFINSSSEIYLEINENEIENIKKEEKNSGFSKDPPISIPQGPSSKELELLEQIKQLTKLNEKLKKEKDLYSEMSQIYKEKIDILEEDKKIKNEKEKSIMNSLENEKKEKNDLIEQLEEIQKLNKSMSLIINNNNNTNNNSISVDVDDNSYDKDILVNNLREEKAMLKNQLNEERKKMNLYEQIYKEDNNKLKQKINNMKNEFDIQKQNILKNNEIIIKKEIEKGINDFISKSKIDLTNKENEINKIKNDYENKVNLIREECYQEIEEKYSKIYEQKIKDIYDKAMNNSQMLYNNIMSQNQKQFEEEEKKRNEIMNSKILSQSNLSNNFSKISQCTTVHKNITCNECKMTPIVGYRYKCLECPGYNLCANCEKNVEHEHNFVKYVNEEKNFVGDNSMYSYECLTSNLTVSTFEGINTAKLSIILKNNGTKKWTNNTLLKLLNNGKNTEIKCNNIKLKELEPNEQNIFEIPFYGLQNLKQGSYIIDFMFSVNEKMYGGTLKVKLNIFKGA